MATVFFLLLLTDFIEAGNDSYIQRTSLFFHCQEEDLNANTFEHVLTEKLTKIPT